MGASILLTPGKCALSAGKTHVHKFLVLGGGVFWVFFWGGGGVPILFLWGRADFSDTYPRATDNAQPFSVGTSNVACQKSSKGLL